MQNPPVFPTETDMSSKNDGNLCQHDYRLNEQIGIVCRLCGFVSTEIKDVSPQLVSHISQAGAYVNILKVLFLGQKSSSR